VPINLIATVKKFISSMQKDAENADVVFLEPKFNKLWLYTKPMHPSEWSSILFNFYTNSKKAIKRASVSGRILIECGESEGVLYLEFTDNGDGIAEDDKDKIFDEFFTTTAPQNLDVIDSNTENLGTGLGLKIVQDIIKSYRGNVLVVSPKEDFSTCIRVEIGKASEKELEDYGL
jgi:signal transduction histidine kinase